MSTSLIERDALVGNLLDRLDELERRIRYMEDTHPGIGGEAAGKLAYYREDGSLHMPGVLYSEENAVWGYYDRLVETNIIADAAAGANAINHTAVPAGEIWVVRGVNVLDNATAANAQCHLYNGAASHVIYHYGTLTIGQYSLFSPGEIILKVGDLIISYFTGCALHDVLISVLWGYKMRVI